LYLKTQHDDFREYELENIQWAKDQNNANALARLATPPEYEKVRLGRILLAETDTCLVC
jgi:hypothetical protein